MPRGPPAGGEPGDVRDPPEVQHRAPLGWIGEGGVMEEGRERRSFAAQREIARTIRDMGADYLLAVKGNQPSLHEALEGAFVGHWDEVHKAVVATSPNYYNITHAIKLNTELIIE